MSESIVESKTIVGIGANVWRLPNTSKPNMGGNTVFAAHRQITLGGFRKTIFTDLPEVKTGDKISVVWDGEKYVYEVYATKTVAPNAVQVTFNTADPIITLITCSYSPFGKKRLVVQAKLVPDESPTIASR
jgi:sortase A